MDTGLCAVRVRESVSCADWGPTAISFRETICSCACLLSSQIWLASGGGVVSVSGPGSPDGSPRRWFGALRGWCLTGALEGTLAGCLLCSSRAALKVYGASAVG